MKVYTLFKQNKKKYYGTAWMQVFFFFFYAAVLVKSKYRIGTQYRH